MMLQNVAFSAVTADQLEKAGVTKKHLIFEPAKVTELMEGLATNVEAKITDLHARIKDIFECVNMDVRLPFSTSWLFN